MLVLFLSWENSCVFTFGCVTGTCTFFPVGDEEQWPRNRNVSASDAGEVTSPGVD